MTDNSQVMAATITGAVLGGIVGYLFCTPQGRSIRRQLESSLEDTLRELSNFQGTLAKATAAASEGMRFLDEFSGALGDGRSPSESRYGTSHQTGPF